MESLAQRAALLRESLGRSQAATDAVVSILGSFDSRLSALDAAMRPIQLRTHAVRTAHENIDRTLRSADVILTQFDRTREVNNAPPPPPPPASAALCFSSSSRPRSNRSPLLW
jgi:exocyst complex protein 7